MSTNALLTGTDAVTWKRHSGASNVPTPLAYEGRLYVFKSYRGILSCLDTERGHPHEPFDDPLDSHTPSCSKYSYFWAGLLAGQGVRSTLSGCRADSLDWRVQPF